MCMSLQDLELQFSVVGDKVGENEGDSVGVAVVGEVVGDTVGFLQTSHV
jgi:hypothetical protein